jgi:hypothetical protein
MAYAKEINVMFTHADDAACTADVARMLCIPHAEASFVAGGVPLGSRTFVSDHLSSRTNQVCDLVVMRTLNIMCINEGLYYLVIWGPVLCMLCIVATGTD